MANIIYKDLSVNGPVESCRELCNELMQLQAGRSNKYTPYLEAMNFENRLKPSFEGAGERFLLVAYDEALPDRAVGYIFCDAFTITEELKKMRFDWMTGIPADAEGLYPRDLPTPVKASHLNNLYVLPEYRGEHIGKELMRRGMEWARSVPDAEYIFVHVSNGNNVGPLYEKYGFQYTHEVFDGLIQGYMQKI